MLEKCPGRDCNGGSQSRQKKLSKEMILKLPDSIKDNSVALSRCSYCGCVYYKSSREPLGYLDGSMTGEGWMPVWNQ